LSQRELARVSGVSQPNIAAIETGRRQPTAETILQLFAACGYELVAAAGERVIRMPLPPEDAPGDVAPEPPLDVPMKNRVAMIVGALDAVDAVVNRR
jgi:transcriptional regulator with XRE-family HTH domain